MRYSITGTTVQQVKAVGGTGIKEARHSRIVFAVLTPEQVSKLRASGCQVATVGKVKAAITPPAPVAAAPTYSPEQLLYDTGLEDLRSMMSPLLYGSGMNLAMIDSGIRETHEKIMGRVIWRKNYTSSPMRDGFSHGTGVCAVALAVAPLCNILNMKVLDDIGEGTEEEVVAAIDECIDLQETDPSIAPTVINLSLGALDDGNPNSPMRVACRAALESGIWVFAAAGNSGPGASTVTSPATEKYVGAIGSVKYEPFVISEFSSRGPTKEGLVKPDMVMFGEDIIVASSESDTATTAKSGTSFSTPFLAGTGALLQEGMIRYGRITYVGEPSLSLPTELLGIMTASEMMDNFVPKACAKPQGVAAGKDDDYGYGVPYGPLIATAVGVVPAMDLSSLIMGMVMVMMMAGVAKAVKV